MTDLPLFYRSVTLLDRERHRDLALAEPQRFGFASGSHVIPAVVDEFGSACRHLPILFVAEAPGPTPVFLAGFRSGHSALVGPDGAWSGRYLPAYLRRYPFILGEVEGADPVVCIDETAAAFGGPQGAGLFDGDGRDTPQLTSRIALVTEYAAAARRTAAFGRTLQDLALLRTITIEGSDPGQSARHGLHGFLAVDEAALASLPDAGLLRLRAEGWLAVIHAHLVSLQSVGDFTLPFVAPAPIVDGPRPAA